MSNRDEYMGTSQIPNLPPSEILVSIHGFLRLGQVLSLIPVGKTTWWNGIKEGRYPQSVRLSNRTTAWRVEDILGLIQSISSQKNS